MTKLGGGGRAFIGETLLYWNLTFAGVPLAEAPPIVTIWLSVDGPSMATLKTIGSSVTPIRFWAARGYAVTTSKITILVFILFSSPRCAGYDESYCGWLLAGGHYGLAQRNEVEGYS